MALPKDKALGVRNPYSVRMGIDHAEWLGVNRQQDPGAIPDVQYVNGINIRVSGSYIQERGGQAKDFGPVAGCPVGVWDLGDGNVPGNFPLLMNGVCRAPNAQSLGTFYCGSVISDTLLNNVLDAVPVAGVFLGTDDVDYDGVPVQIQLTNQFFTASGGIPPLANSTHPRIRSFLASQGKLYVVVASPTSGSAAATICTLARASGTPTPASYSLQPIFKLPHAAWTSCEWMGEQWWAGPGLDGSGSTNNQPIYLSHWDGANLTTEQIGLAGTVTQHGHVQIAAFHETLVIVVLGHFIVRDQLGIFTPHLITTPTIGGGRFYCNALVEYGNLLYAFGGYTGDAFQPGQQVYTWDGNGGIVQAHSVNPRNSSDDSEGMYDACVIDGLLYYTVRTAVGSLAPNDAFIGVFDGTTWNDQLAIVGPSPGANFINSLSTFNGNLVAGFIMGTSGQTFTSAPAGPAGIVVAPAGIPAGQWWITGGDTVQAAILPWTNAPGSGMNGWNQCPGEFLNA